MGEKVLHIVLCKKIQLYCFYQEELNNIKGKNWSKGPAASCPPFISMFTFFKYLVVADGSRSPKLAALDTIQQGTMCTQWN